VLAYIVASAERGGSTGTIWPEASEVFEREEMDLCQGHDQCEASAYPALIWIGGYAFRTCLIGVLALPPAMGRSISTFGMLFHR